MGIISYLQSLGATHLFDGDNNGTLVGDDLGDSVDPTNIIAGNYTFETTPACEGVTYALRVEASTAATTDGAVFDNRNDINGGNGAGNDTSTYNWNSGSRSLITWVEMDAVQNPTNVYAQGGGANNMAIMSGAITTFQAADSGTPFLIGQAQSASQAQRPYFHVSIWEHSSAHAGAGNRILFYVNGVLQSITEDTSTDNFPPHTAKIAWGNSGENLLSYAGTVLQTQTTKKNCNFLGMYNNVSLTAAQCREIFERTTFADVTIAADTVANQQIALDALIGNTYENTNCAIRILQATDATNYRLFVDNITFNADDNIQDISIQFVGTGILTVENTNGTVIQYTSAPPEVETTVTTHTGGGSVVVVNNTQRVSADQTVTNSTATKLVFDGAGTTYTVSGGSITEFENVSGNAVTVTLTGGASLPTLTETSGTLTVQEQRSVSITGIVAGSRLQIYNVTTAAEVVNQVVAGTTYSATYNNGTGYTDGDTVRVRLTDQNGTTACQWFKTNALVTATGWSVLAAQEALAAYATIGIDGSTVTEYSLDSGNLEADANDLDGQSQKQRLVAWYYYAGTSEIGIRDFFEGIVLEDSANAKIQASIVDLTVDNTSTRQLQMTDTDFRLYRDDAATWIKYPSTGGYGIDSNSGKVFLTSSSEITDMKAVVDANLDATVSSRATQTSVDALPTVVPTASQNADAVWAKTLP